MVYAVYVTLCISRAHIRQMEIETKVLGNLRTVVRTEILRTFGN